MLFHISVKVFVNSNFEKYWWSIWEKNGVRLCLYCHLNRAKGWWHLMTLVMAQRCRPLGHREQMLPAFCEKGQEHFHVNAAAKVIKNEMGPEIRPASHTPLCRTPVDVRSIFGCLSFVLL